MHNEKQRILSWARFEAYRANLPSSFNEYRVEQYHSLLSELEIAFDVSLANFRIPFNELNPIPSISMSSRRPTTYTNERYCDAEYVEQQVEGIWRYFNALGFCSKPQRHSVKQGRPMVIRVGEMHDSVIQQGIEDSTATVSFQTNDGRLMNLLSQIRNGASQFKIGSDKRDELEIDLKTIDVQLSSKHPKSSILMESLRSIRAILEGTTGSLIAAGIVSEIGRIIGT